MSRYFYIPTICEVLCNWNKVSWLPEILCVLSVMWFYHILMACGCLLDSTHTCVSFSAELGTCGLVSWVATDLLIWSYQSGFDVSIGGVLRWTSRNPRSPNLDRFVQGPLWLPTVFRASTKPSHSLHEVIWVSRGTARYRKVCRRIREFFWGFRWVCEAAQEFPLRRPLLFRYAFRIGL